MLDEKNWYKSKTMWGGLVALAGALAGMLGVRIDATTQDALVLSLTNGAAAIGALVAIYGRLSAQTTLR